jgi:hypothetical protein
MCEYMIFQGAGRRNLDNSKVTIATCNIDWSVIPDLSDKNGFSIKVLLDIVFLGAEVGLRYCTWLGLGRSSVHRVGACSIF